MSGTRRVLVAIGAPLVLAIGLAIFMGARGAARLKAQLETWVDSLEHSPNPVAMAVNVLPMYVDGERVGKLRTVVVQRAAPGTVDSLRLEVALSDRSELDRLAACHFHLDPDAVDRHGPTGFTRAVRCVTDTTGLVRFGTVGFVETGRTAGLFLAVEDLPCEHMAAPPADSCTPVSDEIRRLRDELRSELTTVREDVRSSVRETVRGR